MYKSILMMVLASALLILPITVSAQEMAMPGADGAELLDYILNVNPYTEWGTLPADGVSDFLGGYLVGGAPHGGVVRIFANDVAVAGALDFNGALPYGSIIVKENFMGEDPSDPGELAALTIMYKVEGFNPDAGDWFWVKSAGDGSAIDAEGTPEGCVNCHGQEGNFDFLLRYGFGETPVVSRGEPMPGPDGEQVMAYILETNPYAEWGSWPTEDMGDFSAFMPSEAVHGTVVRTFVNAIALDAAHAEDFDGVLPAGSIVVKEAYQGTVEAPGDLDSITVMYKIEGFNADANDWFWVKAQPDGTSDAAGALEGCINCHTGAADTDFLFFGFGALEAKHDMMDDMMMEMPAADGDALKTYILETNPYTAWPLYPDVDEFLASESPHGPVVRVFVNGLALEAIEAGADTLPYGSIIVKEGFQNEGATVDAPGEATAITVMYKVEGYNPDAGDWFWLRFGSDGATVAEGMVEGCIGCHGQEGNLDFLLMPLVFGE